MRHCNLTRVTSAAVMFLAMCGCASSNGSFVRTGESVYPIRTAPAEVIVFAEIPRDREYEIVAIVHAKKESPIGLAGTIQLDRDLVPILKHQASVVGGDAILDIRLTEDFAGEGSRMGAQAKAIRWK
jgi:hypothetical protein